MPTYNEQTHRWECPAGLDVGVGDQSTATHEAIAVECAQNPPNNLVNDSIAYMLLGAFIFIAAFAMWKEYERWMLR